MTSVLSFHYTAAETNLREMTNRYMVLAGAQSPAAGCLIKHLHPQE